MEEECRSRWLRTSKMRFQQTQRRAPLLLGYVEDTVLIFLLQIFILSPALQQIIINLVINQIIRQAAIIQIIQTKDKLFIVFQDLANMLVYLAIFVVISGNNSNKLRTALTTLAMQYIAIQNFKSYETQILNNLNPHINIIIGKNGEGKSNFFKAISFAVTNKVSLNKSEFSSHRHTGIYAPKSGMIKVQLYVKSKVSQQKYDQNIQKVERIWHNDTSQEFKANDKTFTPHQFQTYLQSLGFAYSNPYNIIQQGKITQITLMDQFQIYKLLEQATGLKKYQKRLTQALDNMKKNQDYKNEAKAILHDIQTRLNTYQEKRDQYEYYSFEQKAGKVKSKVQFQNLINKFNSELRDLKQKESRSFDQLTKLKMSIRDKQADLAQMNDKIAVNQKQMYSFVQSTIDDQSLISASNLTQEQKQNASRLKKITSNKQKLNKQLQKLSTEVQKIKQEMKPYKEKYQYLTSQLQAMKNSKLGQSKGKQELKNQIKKYEQHVKEIDNELKKVTKMKNEFKIGSGAAQTSQINSKKQRLAVVTNDLRSNKIKYLEVSRQKNQLESQLEVVKQHIEVNYSKMRKLLPYLDFNLLNQLRKQKIQGVYGYLVQFLTIQTDFLFAYELAGLSKLCTLLVQNEQVCNVVVSMNKRIKGRQINVLPLSFVKKAPHFKKAMPEVDDCFSLLNQDWIKIKPHSYGEQFTKILEKIVGNTFGSHLLVKDYDIGLKVSKQYHINCITADKEIVYSEGYLCKVGKDANLDDRLQYFLKYQQKNQQSQKITQKLNQINKQLVAYQNVELDLMKKKVQLQSDIRNAEVKLELINEQKRSLSKLQEQSKNLQQKKLKYEQQIKRKKEILTNFDKKVQININMNQYKETEQLYKAKLKLYNQKSEQECQLQNKLQQAAKEQESINQQLKNLNHQLSFQKELNHSFIADKEYKNNLQQMNQQLLKQKQAIQAELLKMNTLYANMQNENYNLLGQIGIIQEQIGYYSSKIEEIGSLDITMEEIQEKSNSFSLSFSKLDEKRKMRLYSAGQKMIFSKIDSYLERHRQATKKMKELEQYQQDINQMIQSYEREKERSITAIFANFEKNFNNIFKAITLSGKTDLRLKRTNDRSRGLNKTKNSIAIMVSFGGQTIKNWNQFSGGQKTVIAVCLLMALQKCQPAPFYILDEIDSALDQVYLQRIVKLIESESQNSQYFITSFKREMLQLREDRCNYYLVSNRDRVSHIQRISRQQARKKIDELMSR